MIRPAGAALALALIASPAGADSSPKTPTHDRIAVLVTDWGTPEGFSPAYYYGIGYRSRVGEAQTSPRDPCADGFVGTFPFRSQFGVYLHAVAYKTQGMEQAWDGMGVYRLSDDGGRYTSVIDPAIVLTRDQVAGAKIFAMKDVPLDLRARTVFSINKWDPVDHLAGLYQIQMPNGIADILELDVPYWQRVVGLLRPGVKADLNDMTHDMEVYLDRFMSRHFADTVTVRFGNYERIENVSQRHDDVAVALAKDGHTRMVLTRETTDNNHYANYFATRSWIDRGLCKAGFKDKIAITQVRQVGRTPEYNRMVVNNVERYLKDFKPGSAVSLLYVTYGLPWPGGNPSAGPFSAPQPWIKEVYHENAYNNFLSFKRYAEATLDVKAGGKWALDFSKSGGSGSADARTRNLYGYGIFPASYYGDADDPLRFTTIRDNLEQAIRVDGRKQIVLVLSHWYYDGLDNALTIRETNDLPLNTKDEMNRGEFAPRWCERYTGPGRYEQSKTLYRRGRGCPEGWTAIILTEAFDDLRNQFYEGYAQRIRGGIERFGVMPNLGISIAASGAITAKDGGRVAVETGPLAGAALFVPADAHPAAPDGYAWAASFRAASGRDPGNRAADAIRPFNDFVHPGDHLTSAWDDFPAYIGSQAFIAPGKPMPRFRQAVGPLVLIGPYRTLVNAPATITLPYDKTRVRDASRLKGYVFNHVLGRFEPVLAVPGGSAARIDEARGIVSFDTQVFGLFALAEG